MKRKKSYSRSFLPLRVYLDDLYTITQIITEHAYRVSIEADEFQLDNVDEFKQIEQTVISSCEIAGFFKIERGGEISTEFVKVNLGKSNAYTYISDDSISLLRGVVSQVENVLSKSPRLFINRFSNPRIIWPFMIIMLTLSFYVGRQDWHFGLNHGQFYVQNPGWAYLGLLSLIGLAFSTFISYININQHCLIVLKHKHETPSFLERKKDDLILIVISSFLGFLAGLLVALLTR